MEWPSIQLGEVVELFDSRRIPLSSIERAKRPGPYPYYGAAQVFDYIDDFIFDGEYILVGEDGSVVREDGTPFVQYATGRFWVNNHAHVIRPRERSVDFWFLKSALEYSDIAGFVTGAAQPKLNQANMKRIPIPIPPENVQAKIGHVAWALGSLIENNTRRVQVLEGTAQAIYQEWFVELRFPGTHAQGESLSPGWRQRPIGDLGRVVTGATPSTRRPELWGTSVPFITPSDLPGNRPWVNTRRRVSEMAASELATRMLPAGAVCFTCIASIGASCMAQEKSLTNQQINSIIVDDGEADRFFLFHKLVQEKARIQAMASGAATPIINKTAFSAISLEMPPLPFQRRFGEQLEPLYQMVALLEASSAVLRAMRDLLLPRLISGEVNVSKLYSGASEPVT